MSAAVEDLTKYGFRINIGAMVVQDLISSVNVLSLKVSGVKPGEGGSGGLGTKL